MTEKVNVITILSNATNIYGPHAQSWLLSFANQSIEGLELECAKYIFIGQLI
jgi:hypothetical protein